MKLLKSIKAAKLAIKKARKKVFSQTSIFKHLCQVFVSMIETCCWSSNMISKRLSRGNSIGADIILDYYQNTFKTLKEFNSSFHLAKTASNQLAEEIIVEYYELLLRTLQDFNNNSHIRVAENIWEINVKRLKSIYNQIEHQHKVMFLRLSEVTKAPISLDSKHQTAQKLKDLEDLIEQELNKVKALAQRLWDQSINFTEQQYFDRIKMIEELEKLKDKKLDSLLMQWIVNQ